MLKHDWIWLEGEGGDITLKPLSAMTWTLETRVLMRNNDEMETTDFNVLLYESTNDWFCAVYNCPQVWFICKVICSSWANTSKRGREHPLFERMRKKVSPKCTPSAKFSTNCFSVVLWLMADQNCVDFNLHLSKGELVSGTLLCIFFWDIVMYILFYLLSVVV